MFVTVLLHLIIILLGPFFFLYIIALTKKGSSVYRNEPNQKNPMEGKKVAFIKDDKDKENADGVRGHLIAVGEAKPKKTLYITVIKRLFDLVISFFGLVILSPLFAGLAIAIKIDDPGPVFFRQKRALLVFGVEYVFVGGVC